MLIQPATDQKLITGHTFLYDVSLGGKAVTDSDGDPLTYQVRVTSGQNGFNLPKGLTSSGPVISGIPTESGASEVDVAVNDNRGGTTVGYRFYLRVAANAAPIVEKSNTPQLLTAGSIDYDATQNGTTFRDPDGDALNYIVSVRGNPQGLTISGTHVIGTLPAVGAVEVTITASDTYGGVTSDSFLIAKPAAELTVVPNLPTTSYIYRDADLPLPFNYQPPGITLSDTVPAANITTNAGATLGRVLFYDKRLSITNTVSCSSCHEQSHGFASSQRFDTGVLGIPLKRQAMALANVRFSNQSAWFSDMRVTGDLRNLIFVPIDNHDELGMSLFSIESKVNNTSFYPPLFAAAFGTPEVTRDRIASALAQFLQSMVSYQSKNDFANNPMTNVPATPEAVFTAQEMQGFQIYKDHCAICHEFRGNTNAWQANNGLDVIPTDPGVLDLGFRRNGAVGVFRAASLHNIAVSAPYMHDGRFSTLRDVIEQYDHNVQFSQNLDGLLLSGTGAVRLNMSAGEKNALEAYLNTLTDNAFLTDPKFSNPFGP